MATTVKEFAVKLSSDSKQLESSIDKVVLSFQKASKAATDFFGIINKDAKRAGEAINNAIGKEIDDIGNNLKTATKEIKSNADEQLKIVGNNGKERARIEADTQSKITNAQKASVKEAATLERQKLSAAKKSVSELQKEFQKLSTGGFKLSVLEIEKDRPIKDAQALGKALTNTNKETQEKIRRELQQFKSKEASEVQSAQTNLIKILQESQAKQIAAVKANKAKRIQLAGGDTEKLKAIEKQSMDALLVIMKEGEARQAAVIRTGQERQLQIKQEGNKREEAAERRSQGENQKIIQQGAKEQEKAVKDLEKEFEKLSAKGGFKLDAIEIDDEGPIQDVQALGRAVQNENKETQEKIRRQLRRLDSNRAEDIDEGERKLLRIVRKANQRKIQQLRENAQARTRMAGNNAERRIEIERDLQRRIERLQRQGNVRRQGIRDTAGQRRRQAPNEERVGRLGRGGQIFGELQSRAMGATGALGQVLGKLGPIGIGLAAVAGSVLLLGKAFLAAGKTYGDFTDNTQKIKTLLTDDQAQNLDAPLLRLRETAIKTGEPIANLQKGMFNIVSAVPALANNLDAAATITSKASTTALGLGASTDSVALAMTNLGNSLGIPLDDMNNVNMISDVIATTFKQGVIPNAEAMASSIAKAGPEFNALFASSDEAIKSIGSMTAILTANGVSVDESATNLRALGNELLDVNKRNQLFALGIEGISKETGKVEDIRKVISSMAKDSELFTQVFTSKKAKAAVRIFTKEGGQAFSDMQDSFDQAGGASDKMFKTMQDTGANASKRLEASWTEFQLTVGETASNVIMQGQEIGLSALETITELFKSNEQILGESTGRMNELFGNIEALGATANSLQGEMNNLSAEGIQLGESVDQSFAQMAESAEALGNDFPLISDGMQGILGREETQSQESLDKLGLISKQLHGQFPGVAAQIEEIVNNENIGTSEKLSKINEITGQFEGKLPGVAEQMQKVINIQEDKTLETMAKLNEQLGKAQDLLKAEAFVESFNNAELAAAALSDTVQESANNIRDIMRQDIGIDENDFTKFDFFAEADVTDIIAQASAGLEVLESNLASLKAERDSIDTKSGSIEEQKSAAEEIKALNEQIRDVHTAKNKISLEQINIQTGIEKTMTGQFTAAKQLAEQMGNEFDSSGEILRIRQEILDKFDAEGQTADFITQKAQETLLANDNSLASRQALVTALEQEQDLVITGLQEQLAEEDRIVEAGFRGKEVRRDQIAAQLEIAQAERDSLSALTEIASEEQSVDDIVNNIVGAQADIADVLSETVALTQEEADAANETNDIKFEESDIQAGINDLINEKISGEEMTTEEKITQLEALAAQNQEEIAIVAAKFEQVKGEQAKLELQMKTVAMSEQERQSALATAAALREQAAAMGAQINILSQAQGAIQSKIGGIKSKDFISQTLGTGGGGGGGSRSAAKREQAAADRKAEQKKKKAARQAEQEKKKAQREQAKQQRQMQKQQKQQHKQVSKRQNSRESSKDDGAKQEQETRKKLEDAMKKEIAQRKALFEMEIDQQLELNEIKIDSEERLADALMNIRKELTDAFNKERDKSFNAISGFVDQFNDAGDRLRGIVGSIDQRQNEFTENLEQRVSQGFRGINNERKKGDVALRLAVTELTKMIPSVALRTEIGLTSESVTAKAQTLSEEKGRVAVTFRDVFDVVNKIVKDNFKDMEKIGKTTAGAFLKSRKVMNSLDLKLRAIGVNAQEDLTTLSEVQNVLGDTITDNLTEASLIARGEVEQQRGVQGSLNIDELKSIQNLEKIATLFNQINQEMVGTSALFDDINDKAELDKAQSAILRLREDLERTGFTIQNINQLFDETMNDETLNNLVVGNRLTTEQKLLFQARLQLLVDAVNQTDRELILQQKVAERLVAINTQRKLIERSMSKVTELNSIIEGQEAGQVSEIRKLVLQFSKMESGILSAKAGLEEMLANQNRIVDSLSEELQMRKNNLAALKIQASELRAQGVRSLEDIVELKKQLTETRRAAAVDRDNQELKDQVVALTEQIRLAKINNEEKELQAAQLDVTIKSIRTQETAVSDLNTQVKEAIVETKKFNKQLKNTDEAANKVGETFNKMKREKQLEAIQKGIDGLDASNVFAFAKSLEGVKDAVTKAFQIGEFKKGIEGITKTITTGIKLTDQLADQAGEAFKAIDEIGVKLAKGDVGGAVAQAGDLTTKIGTALLSAPPPINIAGAILLGIGIIAKITGKLIDFIVGKQKTGAEIAQENLEILQAQVAAYEAQKSVLSDLESLNSASVDTAQERLDIIRQQAIALASQIEGFSELNNLTDEELAQRKAITAQRKLDLDAQKKQIEGLDDAGQVERQEVLRSLGFDPGAIAGGIAGAIAPGFDLERALDVVNEQIANTEAEQLKIDTVIELKTEEIASLQAVLDEQVQELDFRITASIETGNIQKAFDLYETKLSLAKEQARKALELIGVDLSEFSIESAADLSAITDSLGDVDIPIEVEEAINKYISTLEEEEAIRGRIGKEEFRDQIELVRAREAAEKVTTKKADEEVLDVLEEQLQFLIDQEATELEILAIEAEILQLKQKQNETDMESNEALAEAVRKRQELLEIIRQETGGGSLSAEQRQRVETSEAQIVSELRANGASEEEIQSFLRDLPAFAEGGVVSKTGLALVSKGEPIIPVDRLKEIEQQMQLFAGMAANNNPIIAGRDELSQAAAAIVLEKESQNISNNSLAFGINDIIINVNVSDNVQNPRAIADMVKTEISNTILNTVQRGFDQNKIDIRGNRV